MVPLAFNSLSALNPVKLVYEFNKAEKMTSNLNSFRNGFSYFKHDALENFQDAAFSNKTCLIVTDNIPLKSVFDDDSKKLEVGVVAGSFYLESSSQKQLTVYKDQLFVGGIGSPLLINLIPIGDRLVELKYNKSKYIYVDDAYPYTARVSDNSLNSSEINRQRFVYDFKDGKLSFRTLTKEGWRYLSFGIDQTVRAVGLMLNETTINSYYFTPHFITQSSLVHNFDANNVEVKYFNQLESDNNRETVSVKEIQTSNTNLLITCPTSEISKSTTAKVNIAITKSNFSTTGSYVTK